MSSVTPIPTIMPSSVEYQKAGEEGVRTLWVVFVVMLIASIIFTGLAWSVPVSKRLYHVVTTFITATAALSYFGMALGHGVASHCITYKEESSNSSSPKEQCRAVYWQRYVDWTITTPLLLLDLGLLAGLNGASLTIAIFADVVMILTGLFAAFGEEGTSEKWGWYAIACFAYLIVVYQLATNGIAFAKAKGAKVVNFYTAISTFTLILWTAYPVVWGVADGSRKVGVNEEIIAYAILDILAKPIFGAWLLLTHAKIPESNVELNGFWANGFAGEGQIRIEDDEGA